MKNLAFHRLLRWKMIMLPILTTTLIHFLFKGWENVLFELGSERVKNSMLYDSLNCTLQYSIIVPSPLIIAVWFALSLKTRLSSSVQSFRPATLPLVVADSSFCSILFFSLQLFGSPSALLLSVPSCFSSTDIIITTTTTVVIIIIIIIITITITITIPSPPSPSSSSSSSSSPSPPSPLSPSPRSL